MTRAVHNPAPVTREAKTARPQGTDRAPKKTATSDAPGRGAADGDLSGGLAGLVVAALLLGVLLAVDTRAESSFDSIKTVVAHGGAALAAAVLLLSARGPVRSFRSIPRVLRASAVLAATGTGLAFLSALLSARPTSSLDALRSAALLALLVPVGASRALGRGRVVLAAAAFLAGVSVNAVASLLQAAGRLKLFDIERISGRSNTGAFLGNEGYVALVAALAVPIAAGCLASSRGRSRWAAGGALVLALAALAANPSLTGLTSAATGAAVFLYLECSGRARRRAIVGALLLAVAVPFVPAVRARAADLAYHLRTRNLDALLSYRAGPWAAALEMMRERPLLGVGAGGFESRFVPARLAAERRLHRSFTAESAAGSYVEAHSDLLQAPAELGLPAAAAFAAAFALLIAGLVSRIRESAGKTEPAALLGLLAAGFIAALAWFPMQRALTAAPLLLAAGRAGRVCAGEDERP